MTEREFQIAFERQLNQIIPSTQIVDKLDSDTIFFYLNKAKDYYIRDLYRQFQLNQELSDKLRTLVKTQTFTELQFTHDGNRWEAEYPADYVFALGEKAYIEVIDNECENLISRGCDVIEATIETVDKILENSLSEYHLRYNQAKPVRVYTDNQIVLYTDGKYNISKYELTYLKPAYDLGNDLSEEYTDLPESTHKEIIDVAVQMYIQHKALLTSSNSERSN